MTRVNGETSMLRPIVLLALCASALAPLPALASPEQTAAPDGSYMPYLPDTGRGVRRLRADDGAHFADAGYRIVADLVLERIAARKPAPTEPAQP